MSLIDRYTSQERLTHRQRYLKLISDASAIDAMDNETRRILYSELELLKLNIEENDRNYFASHEGVSLVEEIDEYTKKLNLDFMKREQRWWSTLDELVRFVGVWVLIITFAFFFSLPVICLSTLDRQLTRLGVLTRRQHMAPYMKRAMARTVLVVSGIHLTAQGLTDEHFATAPDGSEGRTVIFFNHASTLDAFVIAATCPCSYSVIAAKKLFLIPFFSWLLIAFGGLPINRDNRAEAIRSMESAARQTLDGDCIIVSPEGTRSTTGQLLPFKKGPLYLWESLNARVVPVIIFGAHELCPPKTLISITNTGRIYVRYLPTIERKEAQTRAHMSKLVRRTMLEELKNAPKDTGGDICVMDHFASVVILIAILALNSTIYTELEHLFFVIWGLTAFEVTALISIVSAIVTAVLYVHAVHVAPRIVNMPACCDASSFIASNPRSDGDVGAESGDVNDESSIPMLRREEP